jgi:hypothetical protein
MTYTRKPVQQARCRLCQAVLYSRTPLPPDISALCTECAIDNSGEAGVVFNRAGTSRVPA